MGSGKGKTRRAQNSTSQRTSSLKVLPDGTKEWCNSEAELHREDGPAVEYPDGRKEWFRRNQYYREDGPVVECENGDKVWRRNYQLHRDDGPAVERGDGAEEWHRNGSLHRVDGPALTTASGKKEYWLYGTKATAKEVQEIKKVALLGRLKKV